VVVVNRSMSSAVNVQPIVSINQNYFTLFGLETSFDLDAQVLENSYYRLQQEHHPDKQSNGLEMAKASAHINTAYHVLKDPLLRAEYLLALDKVMVKEIESNAQDILLEALEQREQLEQASTSEALDVLKVMAKKQEAKTLQTLSQLFGKGDSKSAQKETLRLRYLKKWLSEIIAKQRLALLS
jgi:molecular chaperone HscB